MLAKIPEFELTAQLFKVFCGSETFTLTSRDKELLGKKGTLFMGEYLRRAIGEYVTIRN